MKEFKQNLVDLIVAASHDLKIISLKEVAAANGINHIARQDTQDILRAVLKALPGYRPVQLTSTKNDSLFQSLCFVQDDVAFDDGEDYDQKHIEVSRSSSIFFLECDGLHYTLKCDPVDHLSNWIELVENGYSVEHTLNTYRAFVEDIIRREFLISDTTVFDNYDEVIDEIVSFVRDAIVSAEDLDGDKLFPSGDARRFYLIDSISNGDSFGGDKPLSARDGRFLKESEAVDFASIAWDRLSDSDKARRSEFFVCEAPEDECGCCDLSRARIIKEFC